MTTKCASVILFTAISVISVFAQTTQFTYQGSLKDGATPANGNYDFEFVLFGALSGGTQLGPTNTRNAVAVVNGVFSVFLDFGNQFSAGDNRWLEIRTRPTGQPGFTILTPRQPLTTVPYAWKSQEAATAAAATTATNATQLGGIAANQYVLTGDPRLSDARNPLPNSPNYIQNTTILQPSSNFNISGSGYAGGSLDVGDTYRIGGVPVLKTIDQDNLFVGRFAGFSGSGTGNSFFGSLAGYLNILGVENSFFGRQAGQNNQANLNSFFGARAGLANTDGAFNSFFGAYAGSANAGGSFNSFFGKQSGYSNTSGANNAFFGIESGFSNTTAGKNSFFGAFAGRANIEGSFNSFFGFDAGKSNTTGFSNTFFGAEAGLNVTNAPYNAFFGAAAGYSTSNGSANAFFGNGAGFGNTTGTANTFVGTSSGSASVNGLQNTFIGMQAGSNNIAGSWNTALGSYSDLGSSNLQNASAIGHKAYVTQNNSLVLGSINGINGAGASTNVGIGTTAPQAKLHIVGGNIFIAQPNSLVITAPNGSCWFITVSNTGALSTLSVACP